MTKGNTEGKSTRMLPPVGECTLSEKLYESTGTLVYRGLAQGGEHPVVFKMLREDYPSPWRIAWFRREYETLRAIELEGVVRAWCLELCQQWWAMVLEDFGGESLVRLGLAGTIEIGQFFDLAIDVAAILGQVHQRHIMHKDINPSNIILNPATRQVKLIDFGLATVLTRENPTFRNPNVLEGTLPYMSPEQTGRMNRAMDYRTDLYSLGVTFYELLTGQLPFVSDDALELVHSHIARHPLPPHEINPHIPPPLSAIVLKLMAKNAEDRYQSAQGVRADLEACRAAWQSRGTIEPFVPGQHDVSDRFQIPQKLYGREHEVESLLAAFERVSHGASELMLVNGPAGIGKSALIQELYKPITRQRGYLVHGKFDQLQRDIPYSALIRAFRALIRQILSESEARLATWRARLEQACGPNGQVLIDVIPEIELIIGPQPPVAEPGPTETRNRFNLVFQHFIKTFTRSEHPLVLFLDDLQWADSASLNLMERLMAAADSAYLFVVGAYRAGEVGAGHPLRVVLDAMAQPGADVSGQAFARSRVQHVHLHELALLPLDILAITHLVAETVHCDQAQASSLAELVHARTGGNPFFVAEFLKSIYIRGLINFDYENGSWRWEISRIQACEITDNVIDLMVSRVQQVAEPAREALKLAAGIGNQFDLVTLATVAGRQVDEVALDVHEAAREGLILPLNEDYKLLELDVPGLVGQVSADYKFAHDRIQQAVYALISETDRQMMHWRIGQLLLGAPQQQEERLFDIANHLNKGVAFIATAEEWLEVVNLNLQAGRRAKAAVAYEAASTYLKTGIGLFESPPTGAGNPWEQHYELALNLHIEAAEAAYLSGNFAEMERLATVVQAKASSLLHKVRIYEVKIQAYAVYNRQLEAARTGLFILNLLGVYLPERPSHADIVAGLRQTAAALEGKNPEKLFALPPMSDLTMLATIRILASISMPAYQALPELLPLVVSTMVNLSVTHGHAPESAFAYATYGLILCGAVGDIERGYQFGQLALWLLGTFAANGNHARTMHVVHCNVLHWKEHARNTLRPLQEAYQWGLETGDLAFAALAAHCFCYHSFFTGRELRQVEREMGEYSQALGQLKQGGALNYHRIYHQAVLNFLGQSETFTRLDGRAYHEDSMLPLHHQANDRTALFVFMLNKLVLCYLAGAYDEAVKLADQGETYLDAATGLLLVPVFFFYDSLARLALLAPGRSGEERDAEGREAPTGSPLTHLVPASAYLERVAASQEKLKTWAHHAPHNHQHKFELVEAERSRVAGRGGDAREHYDRAIALARENGYLNEEALAHELAAQFYFSRDMPRFGAVCLREAHYAYMRWGAFSKARALEARYPQELAHVEGSATDSPVAAATMTSISTDQHLSSALDVTSVVKALQAISGEIVLGALLSKMIRIVIENAGAERGFLLLQRGDAWVIEAEGEAEHEQVTIGHSTPLDAPHASPLPHSIINYIARTGRYVVLNDASREGHFLHDPYIKTYQPRSVLGVPLLHKGTLTGMLYLENNIIAGAFTADRLEVLNLLASQVAISIENAHLYSHLEELVEERTAELRTTYQNLKTLNDRMQAELVLARRIQQSLLPPLRPNWVGLDVACYNKPAREVGGDLYAYHAFRIPTSTDPSGRYGLAVGDVSGKGMPAALLMAVSLGAFRSVVWQGLAPGGLLSYLDDALVHYTRTTRQNCALVYLEIATIPTPAPDQPGAPTHTLRVANAGCMAPLIKRHGGSLQWLDVGGMPLGVGMGTTMGYEELSIELAPGDIIVLVSDGVVEAFSPRGEMFGFERLEQAVVAGPSSSASDLLRHLRARLEAFVGETEPHDDLTLVVLQV